jgi:hypothetical protein
MCRIKSRPWSNGWQSGDINTRRREQNKRRSRSRPVQTVLQQMLPFGIERLRRYDLCSSFLSHYRAVPGCNADRERKDGAKNQCSSPERLLTNASSVIPRSKNSEEPAPPTKRTWIPRFAWDDNWDVSDLRTSFPHFVGSPVTPSPTCSLRLP